MPRLSTAPASFAAAFLAALALAACGGGADLLAGDTADEITQNLDRVEDLADRGDCIGAEEATADVSEQVEALEVDSQLKAALSAGVDLLSEVVDECQEEEAVEPTDTVETPLEEPEEEEERRPKPDREEREADAQPEDQTEGETTTPPSEEENEGGEETTPSEPGSPSGGLGPSQPAEGG